MDANGDALLDFEAKISKNAQFITFDSSSRSLIFSNLTVVDPETQEKDVNKEIIGEYFVILTIRDIFLAKR